MIPIIDSKRQYATIAEKAEKEVLEVMRSGQYILGKHNKAFEEEIAKYIGVNHAVCLNSGTDALHLALRALNIGKGDEVITVAFTFVATTEAIGIVGATPVFVDIDENTFNMDADKIEEKITPRTKAILPVHLYGQPCDMDKIMAIAEKYNLLVVEDAAQAIDSFYKGRPLGSIGHLAAFSFHETKNVISGEGGLLAINDERFIRRSEIIWEKGTNRSEFFRGEVNKYGWVDTGSSFLPSEIISAFLYAQLENLDMIQNRRKAIWQQYYNGLLNLQEKGILQLPNLPAYATNNAHMFYLVCRSLEERTALIKYLKENGVCAVFHYLSLHLSDYNKNHSDFIPELPACDQFADCLVRLPMFYELKDEEVAMIIKLIIDFFG